MSKPALFFFCILFCQSLLAKSDPIVEWIKKNSESAQPAKIKAWNPGLLIFDETQIRIETDRNGIFNDQSIRLTTKPLLGLLNEKKLSDKQQQVHQLTREEINEQNLIESYELILRLWQSLRVEQLIKNSRPLFERAKKRLGRIKQDQTIDLNKFVSELAFFEELSTRSEQHILHLTTFMNPQNSAHLTQLLKTMPFFPQKELKQWLNRSDPVNFDLEESLKHLSQYQFNKKKNESYQFFKFLSLSKTEDIQRFEDYRVELAFRIPFLSDNLELENAKTQYLKKAFELRKAKRDKEFSFLQAKADLKGLIRKMEVLRHLPQKSFNQARLSQSVMNIQSSLSSEIDFIKSKLNKIETERQIYSGYLHILKMQRKISDPNRNYLSLSPLSL